MQASFEKNELPKYKIIDQLQGNTIYEVLTKGQTYKVPQELRSDFSNYGQATHVNGDHKTVYLTPKKASETTISTDATVRASAASEIEKTYLGDISNLLSSAYVFSRKQVPHKAPTISVIQTTPHAHYLISLAEARNQTRQWGNGRGDVQGTPQFFRDISKEFATDNGLEITVIEGDDLIKQGFRLMHAVGRASINKPVFVNLKYNGNPNSKNWTAFVGKGVCFDAGGLNIKPTSGITQMFYDKSGAMTVLASFQAVVKQKIPINLTCSIGLVENSINENAYRQSDIIQSRKGLTVEIGNTDAQGRLVLADCMHWTQQKYKTKVLIELSTLTAAVIYALGYDIAGLYTNDKGLSQQLRTIGEIVHETSWELPCNQNHKTMISPKHCDITNNAGRPEAGASQAAAFLKIFVEKGVKWVHLDIAGVAKVGSAATGWGSRLLVEYAKLATKEDINDDEE